MSRTWNGELATRLRVEAGLRPEDIAERLGVHRASVYAWESGREPQLRYAGAFADLFRVTLDSLYVHAPDASEPAKSAKQPAGAA